MNKIFAKLDKAAGEAMRRQDKVFNVQKDPALRRYETLTPFDFDTISRVYGRDNLVRYVRTMENRRMMGGRNG